ncbi:MAG: di-heme enzyme [Leptospiraceae bacterium]
MQKIRNLPGWILLIALSGSHCADKTEDNSALLLALAASGGCAPYEWNLPSGVPSPVVPSDNCQTDARVELGRHLFYDKALSRDESMSCSSCHFQARAFADGKTRPRGLVHAGHPTGELHPRNAQQLSNVAYSSRLTWNNPLLSTLEGQARVPMFSESGPFTIVELGLQNDDYLDTIASDETYRQLFEQAYDGNINEQNVRFALASFQRSMMSFNSTWDKFTRGTATATPAQVRGFELFNGEIAECFHCHGGFNFSDTSVHSNSATIEFAYHNNGTYSDSEYSSKSTTGLEEVTGDSSDRGKFRAPSLRNLALTMPYFHDGSVNCASPPSNAADQSAMEACAREALRDIVDMYRAGGDALQRGQPVGGSVDTTLIRPFTISDADRNDIVEFLLALTDWDFASDSKLSNPRPSNPRFGP